MAVDELHERGLARAVGAHERHVVAAVEAKRDVVVDVVVLVVLRDALEGHDLVARARRLGEAEVHLLGRLGQHDELLAHALELLDALLHLARLGRLVAEALDEGLHVLDVALLGGALGAQLLEVVLALAQVARVVAGVGHEALVLERRDVAHAGVHERAVVADEEDGPVVGGEERLEPLDALEVEVVGRLVEEQQVGVAQQQLRQGDAHLPAARELLGRLVEVLHGKAQAAQDLAGAGLKPVAAQALEAVLRATIAVEKSLVRGGALLGVVGAPALGRDLLLHGTDVGLETLDLGLRVHDLGKRALLARELGLLLEVADARVLGERHRALVGRLLAHEDLEQRRLAGAVGTHEAPALAGVELQGSGRVQDTAAE